MFRISCQLRSTDFDSLGHLNQSVYHSLFEQGRIRMMMELWDGYPDVVLAKSEVDHRSEVPLGSEAVDIESRVDSIGTSSFVIVATMTRDREVAAEGRFVIVGWNPERRESRPLTEPERLGLERAMARAVPGASG